VTFLALDIARPDFTPELSQAAPGQTRPASLFDGLPHDEVEALLASLARRHYPNGSTLIAEGDHPHAMFIVVDGVVDVVIRGTDGTEHPLNRLGAGAILGEMSLLSGAPASATVRAVGELHVLVMPDEAFFRTAARLPRLYQNLGHLLALRVANADRRIIGRRGGTLSVLHARGAPPEVSEALAASVAWHTRRPTLLLVLDEHAEPSTREAPGFHRVAANPVGAYSPTHLARTLDDLAQRYDHILVQTAKPVALRAARQVFLLGPNEPRPRDAGQRPGTILRAWSLGDHRAGPAGDGTLHVPPLRAVDTAMLREGWLASATPAGRRLGWAARDLTGRKVGLALGSGGLMGYAHLGVLRVFERAGLSVDYLAGTSIGGVVASLYALDHGPDAIADILDAAAATLVRPALSTRSLLSAEKLRCFLRAQGEHARFEDLRVPLALLATDIDSGNEVVLRQGLIWPATLATVAIPGLFPAQPIGPHMLVDGAVLNPVPGDVVGDMGADVAIAVRLRSGPATRRQDAAGMAPSGSPPSMLEVLTRSLDLMQSRVSPHADVATTVLVEPHCEGAPGIGLRNFTQGRRYIQAGEAAARSALPRISTLLPWLKATEPLA
jgi:NTE family protein